MSRYPWFPLFSNILTVIQSRRIVASTIMNVGREEEEQQKSSLLQRQHWAISSFLEKLEEHPFPLPGEQFTIVCPSAGRNNGSGDTELISEYRFKRHNGDAEMDIRVEPLLRRLGSAQLLTLIACCLDERRICFVGSTLSLVSNSVHALMRLIYPFQWQHVFIPVLPAKLLSYVCAPMPYIVGIHTSMLPEVLKLPTEKMVIVNLDRRSVSGTIGCLQLPGTNGVISMVRRQLQQSQRVEDENLLDSILKLFVRMVGDYRLFMQRTESGHELDIDAFIDDKSVEVRSFLHRFKESQMFQTWLSERRELLLNNSLPDGSFELACSRLVPWAYGIGQPPTSIRSPLSRKKMGNMMSSANVAHTAKTVRNNLIAGGRRALQKSQHHGKSFQQLFKALTHEVGLTENLHNQETASLHRRSHQSLQQSPTSNNSTSSASSVLARPLPPVPTSTEQQTRQRASSSPIEGCLIDFPTTISSPDTTMDADEDTIDNLLLSQNEEDNDEQSPFQSLHETFSPLSKRENNEIPLLDELMADEPKIDSKDTSDTLDKLLLANDTDLPLPSSSPLPLSPQNDNSESLASVQPEKRDLLEFFS